MECQSELVDEDVLFAQPFSRGTMPQLLRSYGDGQILPMRTCGRAGSLKKGTLRRSLSQVEGHFLESGSLTEDWQFWYVCAKWKRTLKERDRNAQRAFCKISYFVDQKMTPPFGTLGGGRQWNV